jgi:alkyl hydroperoxide reductase subunit AhpC
MKRIGDQALPFRLPALGDDGFAFINPDALLGRWVVLSFVQGLNAGDSALWDDEGRCVRAFGATLLVVPSEAKTVHRPQIHASSHHFTIVADPLGRLQRLYGGRTLLSSGTARTFLVDPGGRLRFHVVHSVSPRGMDMISEVLFSHRSEQMGGWRGDSKIGEQTRECLSPVACGYESVPD